MKARCSGEMPTLDAIKQRLEESNALPGYTFSKRMNRFIVAKKTGMMGANILPRKDGKFQVAGNFPSQGLQMLFLLLIFLTVLIVGVLYFIFLYPKHRAVEKEVVAALEKLYYDDGSGAAAEPVAAATATPPAAAAPAPAAEAPTG